jgi:DNA-directed RNA polymerase subunit H (RpoH/RPB5)
MSGIASDILKVYLSSVKEAEPVFEKYETQRKILEVTRDGDPAVKHLNKARHELHGVISRMFGDNDRLISFHVFGSNSKPYIEATVQCALGNRISQKRYLIRQEGLGLEAHNYILGQSLREFEKKQARNKIQELEGYLKKIVDIRNLLGKGYKGVPSTEAQLVKDIEEAKKVLKAIQDRPKETPLIEEMDD